VSQFNLPRRHVEEKNQAVALLPEAPNLIWSDTGDEPQDFNDQEDATKIIAAVLIIFVLL